MERGNPQGTSRALFVIARRKRIGSRKDFALAKDFWEEEEQTEKSLPYSVTERQDHKALLRQRGNLFFSVVARGRRFFIRVIVSGLPRRRYRSSDGDYSL